MLQGLQTVGVNRLVVAQSKCPRAFQCDPDSYKAKYRIVPVVEEFSRAFEEEALSSEPVLEELKTAPSIIIEILTRHYSVGFYKYLKTRVNLQVKLS